MYDLLYDIGILICPYFGFTDSGFAPASLCTLYVEDSLYVHDVGVTQVGMGPGTVGAVFVLLSLLRFGPLQGAMKPCS